MARETRVSPVTKSAGRRGALLTALVNERTAVVLIFLLAVILRTSLALTIPPWQSPDEPKHFEYVRTLIDKGEQFWHERRLPAISDASPALETRIIASMAENHYWEYLGGKKPETLPQSFFDIWGFKSAQLHRPSLYYYFSALCLWPFKDGGLEQQLLVVRFFSVLLSALSVVVTYRVGKEVLPRDPFVSVVSAAFVAMLPMHSFIGATVNTDNLATLTGSIVILAVAQGIRRGFRPRDWVWMILAMTLALLSKRTVAGLLPVLVVCLLIWLSSLRGRRLVISGSVVVLTLGLGLVFAFTDLYTRFAPLGKLREMIGAYALNEADQFERLRNVPLRSSEAWDLVSNQANVLFQSFWGVFGWFSFGLSPDLYRVLVIVSLVCLAGFLVWQGYGVFQIIIWRSKIHLRELISVGVMSVGIISMIVLSIGERLAYFSASELPQGRYLFVVIAPIAIAYALGLRTLLPRRWLGTLAAGVPCLAGLAALWLVAYSQYIWPFYRGRVWP